MKWWKVLLAIGALIVVALVVLMTTKPDRSAHYDAVKNAVLEVVSKELNENPALQPYAAMGTMKALEATDNLLTRGLVIRDRTYYNIGFVIYKDKLIPVSIGILGQIHLTMDQQDLEGLLKRPDILEIIDLDGLKSIYGL